MAEAMEVGEINNGVGLEEATEPVTTFADLIERADDDATEAETTFTSLDSLNNLADDETNVNDGASTSSNPYGKLHDNNVAVSNYVKTQYKKDFFKKEFGVFLNKGDGQFSKELLDNSELISKSKKLINKNNMNRNLQEF